MNTEYVYLNFAVEPIPEESYERQLLAYAIGDARASTADKDMSSTATSSSMSERFGIGTSFEAPMIPSGITRSSAEESTQNSNMLELSNNTNPNGISIFQGY